MVQLSYDLHVHPAPSSVPRWGSGAEVRAAAARAGVRGFVWKSHEEHTIARARALPPDGPIVIGSASLNAWATPTDVLTAVGAGARWLWGPSRAPGMVMGWDLPLPTWWPVVRRALERDRSPLVLATGHADAAGRESLARAARAMGDVCSVTHALRLPDAELERLVDQGCVLEVDLYTAAHPVTGLPAIDLASGLERLRTLGLPCYLVTDAGQAQTGDPYAFSASVLASLAERVGERLVHEAAVAGPERLVSRLGLAA